MTGPEKARERVLRRDFHIGDILSVTTGRLVSPTHMEGVYNILNFMTGDSLMTHQLGRAAGQCKPHLLTQHPQLEEVDASGVNEKNWKGWLGRQAVKYGAELPVEALPLKDRVVLDHIKELEDTYPGKKIISIDPEDLRP